jgi:glycogen synthase
MHVLMTADTVGGVWTYTHELVRGLLRRGHRVTLVSFGGAPSAGQTAWLEDLENLDFHATDYRLEWMQDSAADISASAAWLQQLIKDVRPDLLHFNQYAYGAIPTSLPKLIVAHSDVVSWWINARNEEPPDNPWLRWYRGLVNEGLRSADMVIAPSQWMLDSLKTYYATPNQTQVIYNARDAAAFRSVPKQNCVLTVGRLWDEAKQVTLLEKRTYSVPVYVAGSESHPESLGAEIGQLRSGREVSFLGPMSSDQLRDLYAKAAIYAGTSRYEPFGLAPLEAALSSCALLLNDIPSFREIWGDAVCYFERNSAESLAAEVHRLVTNPELRERYGARALERARTLFNPDRMLNSYEQVYTSLASQEVYA